MSARTSMARATMLALALPGAALGVAAMVRYVQQWPLGFHPILFVLIMVVPPAIFGAPAMLFALIGKGRGGELVRPSGRVTALGLWVGGAGAITGGFWLASPLWPTRLMAEVQMSPPVRRLPTGPDRVVACGGSEGFLSFDIADGRFAKWSTPDSGGSSWTWRAVDKRLFAVDFSDEALVVRSVTPDGKSVEAFRASKQDFVPLHVDPYDCEVLADGERMACTGNVRPDDHDNGAVGLYFLMHGLRDKSPLSSRMITDAHYPGRARVSSDGRRVFFDAECMAERNHNCLNVVDANGTGRTERDLGTARVCSVWPSSDGALVAFVINDQDRGCNELWMVDGALSSPRKIVTLERTDNVHSWEGIYSIAWSPSGRLLAVESDHDGPGCQGYEGVTGCSGKLYVVDLTTAAVREVSPRYLASQAFVWTP